MKFIRIVTIGMAIVAAVAIIVVASRHDQSAARKSVSPPAPQPATLPAIPGSYLGVYRPGFPGSYDSLTAFTTATGVRPGIVVYYSGWREPFRVGFAAAAAKDATVPLVQIEPTRVSLAAIASGRYDDYISSYAEAIRAYHQPVILSFGHEMNGSWYSWGYRHTPPAVFVAAWRHIVTLFRTVGANNATWLWTVNIIHDAVHGRIPGPGPWWPGSSYVTWVGIDGYYYNASRKFAPLFGPTIAAVRQLTQDPILIAETGASPAADQPAKIADLFSGVHTYGLLGFVWFDASGSRDWRLNTPTAIAAFRHGAETYKRPVSS